MFGEDARVYDMRGLHPWGKLPRIIERLPYSGWASKRDHESL